MYISRFYIFIMYAYIWIYKENIFVFFILHKSVHVVHAFLQICVALFLFNIICELSSCWCVGITDFS